jgi:hypothetical protein
MLFKIAPKIAAVVYVLWGLIHIAGGAAMLNACSQGADAFVQMLSGNSSATLGAGALQASPGLKATTEVFAFHSFNIICLGILSIFAAIFLNWKNSRAGYWLNLAIVGFADLGLILFMVAPGVMQISDAWIGPVLFVFALVFSTLGRFSPS